MVSTLFVGNIRTFYIIFTSLKRQFVFLSQGRFWITHFYMYETALILQVRFLVTLNCTLNSTMMSPFKINNRLVQFPPVSHV